MSRNREERRRQPRVRRATLAAFRRIAGDVDADVLAQMFATHNPDVIMTLFDESVERRIQQVAEVLRDAFVAGGKYAARNM